MSTIDLQARTHSSLVLQMSRSSILLIHMSIFLSTPTLLRNWFRSLMLLTPRITRSGWPHVMFMPLYGTCLTYQKASEFEIPSERLLWRKVCTTKWCNQKFQLTGRPELLMTQENIFKWQFEIRGPTEIEFEGGIYHGRIQLPSEYPFKPPSFMLLTLNGRFETQTKICLSISNHHPEHWQPSWSG